MLSYVTSLYPSVTFRLVRLTGFIRILRQRIYLSLCATSVSVRLLFLCVLRIVGEIECISGGNNCCLMSDFLGKDSMSYFFESFRFVLYSFSVVVGGFVIMLGTG